MNVKLKSVKLKNFLSFTDEQEIVFPSNGLLLLKGENGSGKTSILEAIVYALDYCSTPSTELQSFLSYEPLYVKLTLNLDDEDLVIERSPGNYLVHYQNQTHKNSEAINKIKQLLLLPEFIQFVTYRPQGQIGNFLTLKAGEKQEFLNSLLDLSKLENIIEKSADKIKDLISIIERKEQNEGDLVLQKARLNNSLLQNEVLDVFAKEEELEHCKNNLPQKNSVDISQIEKDILNLKSNPPTLSYDIPEMLKLENNKKELEKVLFDISNKIDPGMKRTYFLEINEIEKYFKNLPQKIQLLTDTKVNISSLEHNTCFTCEQPWINNKERLIELEKQAQIYLSEVNIETQNKYTQTKKIFQEELNKINDLETQQKDLKNQLHKLDLEITNKENLQKLKNQSLIKDHENKIKQLEQEKNNKISLNELEYKNQLQKVAILESEKKHWLFLKQEKKDKEVQLQKLNDDIDKLSNEIKGLTNNINLEKELQKCLKQDFVRLITEDTINLLNQYSNDILHSIPNGSSFNIMFDLSRLNKNGLIKKEINLKLFKHGKEIKRVSGGENCCINLATDLSISKIISLRGGKTFDYMIFDESFDGMSSQNKQFALQILKELSINRLIILVEHTGEIGEMCDKIIEVKNSGNGSVLISL